MKEYQVYTRMLGMRGDVPEPTFTIKANTQKEALKKARQATRTSFQTVDHLELLGTLNPKYNPERALRQAIMNERVSESRYI
jgi:hypothetical protein